LCIIQDSKEDWNREAAMMGKVYANSEITIAASRTDNCQGGFLSMAENSFPASHSSSAERVPPNKENTLNAGNLQVRTREFVRKYGQFRDMHFHLETSNTLHTRGWAFQERELCVFLPSLFCNTNSLILTAQRILHFSHYQMFWECRRRQDTEADALVRGQASEAFAEYGSKRCLDIFEIRSWHARSWPKDLKFTNWCALLESYSNTSFTYTEDRIPALSGLVAAIHPLIAGKYCAGLWEVHFPKALLWSRKYEAPIGQRICEPGYRLPSWSWLSVTCPITYDLYSWRSNLFNFKGIQGQSGRKYTYDHDEFCPDSWEAEVTSVATTLAGTDPYGRLKDGYLRIRSLTKRWDSKLEKTDPSILYDIEVPSSQQKDILLLLLCLWKNDLEKRRSMSTFSLALRPLGPPGIFERVGVVESRCREWWQNAINQEVTII